MKNKRQSAVEWLVDEIEKNYIINNGTLDPIKFMELKRQAKSMEKKQKENYIRFGYMAGFNRGLDNNPNHLEEYIEYIKTLDK